MCTSLSCGISYRFQQLSPARRQVTYALLTRSRLMMNGGASSGIHHAFHLHVLGTPPAFVLSQDQTLIKSFDSNSSYCQLSVLLFFCFVIDDLSLDKSPCTFGSSSLIFKGLVVVTSLRQLYQFITSSRSCQYFFETFFRSLCIDRPQETTQLFYHLHLLLSTTFLNFFVSLS